MHQKIKERTSIRVASTKTLKSNSIMGYFGVTKSNLGS